MFDDFLTSLKELAKTCDFCEGCQYSLLRDRIVTGIRNADVVKKLLAIKSETLEAAIELCRVEESAERYRFGLVYWGLTPQQQPASYQGGEMMMMKSVIWWRKPEYPEETTDLRQKSR